MRELLDLVTVCEDAGCPNLSECWSDGTATFMVLGERCTRACGFCLVDTRKPLRAGGPTNRNVSPRRSTRMRLDHVVLTMVARDDLRRRRHGPRGPMCRGDPAPSTLAPVSRR